MTFPELEKACKKRRLFKILRLILFLLFFAAASLSFVYFKTKNGLTERNVTKSNIETKKDFKEKNATKAAKIKIKNLQKQKKVQELKLIIDLNVSEKKPVVQKTNNVQKNSKKTEKTVQKPVEKASISSKTLPSYSTCIALAEKYYKQGDYKKALKWAKNANIQNNKKPESWILSAKALYKLGKKQSALNILKIYYNYHKDEKVKKLMGEINENGN